MIANLISQLSTLSPLNKFDQLVSACEYIKLRSNRGLIEPTENISLLLSKIEELRFELSHNKGNEAISSRLDRMLALLSLDLARIAGSGKHPHALVNAVKYYERIPEVVAEYDLLIQ